MSSTAYQYAATDRDGGLDTGAPGHTPIPQNLHPANAPPAANPNKYMEDSPDTSFGDRPLGTETYNARPAGMGDYGGRRVGMTDSDMETPFSGTGTENYTRMAGPGTKPDTSIGTDSDTRFTGAGTGTGTGMGTDRMGTDTMGEGEMVLHVDSPDAKTIRVSGDGAAYTLRTTYENRNQLVTIHRDEDGGNAAMEGEGMGTGTASLPTAGAPVARVELHQLRASKISLKGGPQIKLKNWLGGRGTWKHTFEDGGQTYEWRKSIHGLAHKLELFAEDNPETRIAWAEKLPVSPQAVGTPAGAAKAKLTLTARARPMMDAIVVSFLLVDRESRENPLHG